MSCINLLPLASLLLILYGSEILADFQGIPVAEVPNELLKVDDSDPKADSIPENDVDGLLKYAGVFGGNENDYPQDIEPLDSSLQAHVRVKRFGE